MIVSATAFRTLLMADWIVWAVWILLGDLHGEGIHGPAMEAAHRRRLRGTLSAALIVRTS